MMLNYVCHADKRAFQTGLFGTDGAYLLGVWIKCPMCRADITLQELPNPPEYSLLQLHPQELYRASQGDGLPGEKDISEANITRILTTGTVLAVELSDPTEKRILIDVLTVRYQDKVLKLHFGASNQGAVIFKITEAR